jgi:hypothetical protein
MAEKDIFTTKKDAQTVIKNKFGFPRDHKFTGLVLLSNEKVLTSLLQGLRFLPVNFLVLTTSQVEADNNNIVITKKLDSSMMVGFDFVVTDDDCDQLQNYLKNGVVPIITKDNRLSSLLSEFNPMKNEGNSFLYDKENEWCVFHALTRYMENAKFPFDNRNLVKNVLKV